MTLVCNFLLNPFCGCATALVAAEQPGHQWVGIELSLLAIKLVKERIRGDNRLWANLNALERSCVEQT